MNKTSSFSLVAEPQTSSIENLATYLKAVADPLRLEVLRVLVRDSFGVVELSRIFSTTQPGMSHHLKILSKVGLVASRREGNSIYYRRSYTIPDAQLRDLQKTLFSYLDEQSVRSEVTQNLEEIRLERSQASQGFFSINADKFRQQQDLIASYDVYADHVKDFLLSLKLKNNLAIELGPGQGEFLTVLSPLFKHVLAVDNSPSMLQQAQNSVDQGQLQNVSFQLGDSSELQRLENPADCIVINMVLHHTATPADIFHHVSSALNLNGHVVVTDLCRHDQQWARESCGDLWLGFDPEELTQWARDAGLQDGQKLFFAQRNGFQIQIRHFFKK